MTVPCQSELPDVTGQRCLSGSLQSRQSASESRPEDNTGTCATQHELTSLLCSESGRTVEYIAVCCDCLRQDAFITSYIRVEVLHEVKAFP